jgi:hypothetical protein
MRQLWVWGIKVRCGGRKASRGRSIPRRERQKIKAMTTSLVDVSVVLLWLGWRSTDSPSNAWIGNITVGGGDGAGQANSGR